MKMSKLSKTVKRAGSCYIVHGDGEMWMGTGYGLYRASAAPMIHGSEQAGMILSLPEIGDGKISYHEGRIDDTCTYMGLDLRDAAPEQIAKPFQVPAVVKGKLVSCLRTSGSGRLVFYDPALLAPIEDDIRRSEYREYTVRETENGAAYIAVKNGMEVLGVILPVRILDEEYLRTLQSFWEMCRDQYAEDRKRAALRSHRCQCPGKQKSSEIFMRSADRMGLVYQA